MLGAPAVFLQQRPGLLHLFFLFHYSTFGSYHTILIFMTTNCHVLSLRYEDKSVVLSMLSYLQSYFQ